MVVAVACEFFNKWCFSVFDTVVPVYGQYVYELDSFTFSMMSVVGSLVNIFQTGWLFNFLIKKDWSIPTITSVAGGVYRKVMSIMSSSNLLYLLLDEE